MTRGTTSRRRPRSSCRSATWSRRSSPPRRPEDLKDKLLAAVEDARRKERQLEAACTDLPANPDGRWNAKDHLAHSAWWRDRDGRLIDAVHTGSIPPPAVGSREGQDDGRQNEVVYRRYRDTPLAEIAEYASSAWD